MPEELLEIGYLKKRSKKQRSRQLSFQRSEPITKLKLTPLTRNYSKKCNKRKLRVLRSKSSSMAKNHSAVSRPKMLVALPNPRNVQPLQNPLSVSLLHASPHHVRKRSLNLLHVSIHATTLASLQSVKMLTLKTLLRRKMPLKILWRRRKMPLKILKRRKMPLKI